MYADGNFTYDSLEQYPINLLRLVTESMKEKIELQKSASDKAKGTKRRTF